MDANLLPALLVIAFWVLPSLLFAVLLPLLAGRRGLSRAPWILVGLIPVANVVGLIFLALKPTVTGGDADG